MATLVKIKDASEPKLMSIVKNNDDIVYASINVNICQLSDGTYEWDSLVLPDFALNNIHNAPDDVKYNVLVAHIVKAYYDDNHSTAVLSNYLSDMSNEKYKYEFDELQKVRKLAKTTAREIIRVNIF